MDAMQGCDGNTANVYVDEYTISRQQNIKITKEYLPDKEIQSG